MKKTLIAVAAALLLIGGFAFAQDASSFTFGAWLRTVFAPVASDGDKNYTDATNSWGYGIRQSRLNAAATAPDGLAGLKADFYIDNGSVGMGDNAYLWLQPHEMIKASVGKFDSPEMGMRGDLCYGSWNWIRPTWVNYDEGLTFSGNGSGMAVQLTPMEGLLIYGLVPVSGDFGTEAYKVWGKGEVAASYALEGIGVIKVGYFGKYDKVPVAGEDYERYGDLEVAFDARNTLVEGLDLTVGFQYRLGDDEAILEGGRTAGRGENEDYKIEYANGSWDIVSLDPTDDKWDYGSLYNMRFALGAAYQVTPEFKVSASGRVFLYPSDVNIDPTFDAGVGIDYALMDGLNLAADFRYKSETKGDYYDGEDDGMAFLVGVNKSVGSNGSIGVGFQGVTNGRGFINDKLQNTDKFAWAVPVALSVWF